MRPNAESDPLSEAPLLRSIPKVDPFAAPESFFERFPHQVQQAIAEREAAPWWRVGLSVPRLPRLAWGLSAALVAVAAWFAWPAPQHDAPQASMAQVEPDEQLFRDPNFIAELSADGGSAPGVQHDLSADELAAYLLAHDATDYLTELQ
jgi:hypothetical protein